MKIAFFTMRFHVGGAERVISTLCNEELIHNNDVSIVTCIGDDSEYLLDERIERYGLESYEEYTSINKNVGIIRLCKKYKKIMKEINPDIIISFLPEPCFIAGLMRKKLGIPIIGSERGNPYYEYSYKPYNIIANWLYSKADGFVFQTEGAQRYFKKEIQKKSIIIGNPINTKLIIKKFEGERKKEIVSVGRMTKEKNYPLLLEAFAIVNKKCNEYVLKIYGKIDENLGLDNLACELGITDKVIFMGKVDNVTEKINEASIFVLSSLSEGMPNALMEAMAIGMPVIATDCPSGGPRQLIQNGYNGILVENNNKEELADKIIELISDNELKEKLSKSAMKIVDDYNPQIINEMWKKYIYKIYKENQK